MASPPYIFFHHANGFYRWKDGTDPILVNCQNINEEAAKPFLTSLTVNVAEPDGLLLWLDKNDPAYITDLHVIVEAVWTAPSAACWNKLFEKLGREATNLQHLQVWWDYYNPLHKGLGSDVCFVRALT